MGLESFGEFLAGISGNDEGETGAPIAVRHLLTAFLPQYPVMTIGEEAYWDLRTVTEAIDFCLRGEQVQLLDLLVQRYKAIMKSCRDKSWSSAKWMQLIPMQIDPSITSLDEEEHVQSVELKELRIRELAQKLRDKGRG